MPMMLMLQNDSNLGDAIERAAIMLVPVTFLMASGIYAAVVGFARQRRLEREALYRSDLHKKMVEEGRLTGAQLLAAKDMDRRDAWLARREQIKQIGIVMVALSLGLMGFSLFGDLDAAVRGAGFIPLALGVATLVYGRFMYPDYEPMERSGLEEGDEPPRGLL